MTDQLPEIDPRYVAARRVLLDVLEALAPHRQALIVAGAQAVYLRTGLSDVGIAPYTTDGDLALDPTLLGDEPELEQTMRDAGFRLLEPTPNRPEPGAWYATAVVDGEELVIPIGLILPEGVSGGVGRRGARLGPHGNRAAHRAVGLEAALVDHSTMRISALDPADGRSFPVEVAGSPALMVAKAHKIHDRLGSGRPHRLDDKDAADVYRLMQTTSPHDVATKLAELRQHPMAGPPTDSAIIHLTTLFGRPRADGVAMATRALRLAIPEARVSALCVSYIASLVDAIGAASS